MCRHCEDMAREHWGKSVPDPCEFLATIKARAEISLEAELLSAGCELSPEGLGLARGAFHEALTAVASVMAEDGVVWAPAWIAFLGQEAARALAEEEAGDNG